MSFEPGDKVVHRDARNLVIGEILGVAEASTADDRRGRTWYSVKWNAVSRDVVEEPSLRLYDPETHGVLEGSRPRSRRKDKR